MLLAALAGGVLSHPGLALIFGATAFSGAGCISVAATMRRRVYAVSLVYLTVALLALLTGALAAVLSEALFPNFYLFSALLLITLGLEMLGIRAGISAAEVAKVGLAVVAIYSLLHLPGDVELVVERSTLQQVLLSVLAGYLTTLLGGALLGGSPAREHLRRISGAVLVALGVKLLV